MVGTTSSSIVETAEVTQEILLVIEDGLSVTSTVEAIGVENSSFCD